jgi:histidyl-tRNA synthetase
MKLDLPRGMRDLSPEEFYNINFIKDVFLETTGLFNFKFVEPSPLELVSTLEAKAGSAISNDVYSFTDKGDRKVALRFDLTIGLSRFVTGRRDLRMPSKIASFAGVWRYDEPQAGRYRYFHQWDIEIYGSINEESEAEVIEFTSIFLKKLGLKSLIDINNRQVIEEYLRQRLDISDEAVMLEMYRAIDKVPKKGAKAVEEEYRDKIDISKLHRLINLSSNTGSIDSLSSISDIKQLANWNKLVALSDSLRSRKINNVRINLGIVRGLDYYSGTVFEVFDPTLYDMGALVGGGRYDRLTESFGRKDLGAIGAAGGVERIIIALQKHGLLKQGESQQKEKKSVYVAYLSDKAKGKAIEIVSNLRNNEIIADYDFQDRSLRKQLEDAYSNSAVFTIIVSDEEFERGQTTVRSMNDGCEQKQSLQHLVEDLKEKLKVHTAKPKT